MSNIVLPTQLFIDGVFVAGEGEAEKVLNPSTGELLVALPEASVEQVHKAVSAAHRAFDGWSESTPMERSRLLLKVGRRRRSARRTVRPARIVELWQALCTRAGRRDPGGGRLPALLCRRGALRQRHGGQRVPGRSHQHDPPRPDRRGGLDRAVELPADDGGVEDRTGAGRGQHRGHQAQRADAADDAAAGPGGGRDLSEGRAQRHHRPWRQRRPAAGRTSEGVDGECYRRTSAPAARSCRPPPARWSARTWNWAARRQ